MCLAAAVLGWPAPLAASTAAGRSVASDSSYCLGSFGSTATAGINQVSLTWCEPQNPGSYVRGYNVYEGTSSGGEDLETPVASTSDTSATVTGLTSGTAYFFVVEAIYSVGDPISSNEVSAIPQGPPATAPGAPTGLTATVGSSEVSLAWTAPDSDGGSSITAYNVYEGTSPAGESGTPITTATDTSATVTGLTSGIAYYFVVTAVNAAGEGPRSDEASATLTVLPPPHSTPPHSTPAHSTPAHHGTVKPPTSTSSPVLLPVILLGVAILAAAVALVIRRLRLRSRSPSAQEPSVRVDSEAGPPRRVDIQPTGSQPTVTLRIEQHPGAGSTKIEEMHR